MTTETETEIHELSPQPDTPAVPEEDEYKGPFVKKRIEWTARARSHEVELFGSWDRFKGSKFLEYYGQNKYAIELDLPIGEHVYRFWVDGEDWETDDGAAKTVKQGIEYNTISVKLESEENQEEEEEEEEETQGESGALVFDESTGSFVIGKSTKGRKNRRGRPSMEIQLDTTFVEEAQKVEMQALNEESAQDKSSTDTAAIDKKKKKRKKTKKSKMKPVGLDQFNNNVDLAQAFKQKEEEWARMCFVQQLKQQQQHNDEINRVKTLWKQERQVRVEMHKKVMQEKNRFQKEISSLQSELEKAQAHQKIGEGADKRRVEQLELEKKQLTDDINNLRNDLRKSEENLNELRKEKVEFEKSTRNVTIDYDSNKKKLAAQVNQLNTEILSLKSQNETLRKNLDTIKEGHKQTLDLQMQQFTTAQKRWEDEKEELIKLQEINKKNHSDNDIRLYDENIKKLNEQLDDLTKKLDGRTTDVAEISTKLNEAKQEITNLKSIEESLLNKVKSLETTLEEERNDTEKRLQDSTEELNKLNKLLENTIQDKDNKIHSLEDELNKNKSDFSEKLNSYNNLQTSFQSLQSDFEVNKNLWAREKEGLERSLITAQKKDTNIINACKLLFQKFQTLRTQMDEIRNSKIEELEKMNEFFPNFNSLLEKAFGFHHVMVNNLMDKYKRELSLRRKYFNELQDLRGNIRVFCRIRPLLPFELQKGDVSCVTFPRENEIDVKDDKETVHHFEFDRVYNTNVSQENVSLDTTEYIQSVMDGYNVSIFAYGQTGSGKTFTMEGPGENPGVNLRALKHLFKMAEERMPMFEYQIKVSIFEIYNEKIRDLLVDDMKESKDADYKIRHKTDGSVEVEGIKWVAVHNDKEVMSLNEKAKKNRTAAVTDMNEHSSRSHMLLVVDVHGFNVPANIEYQGKLYLVDLAGSERVKKSGAQGQALTEAKNINKSLAALGDVMEALQKKSKFIPYRNSTLTDLMQNSLGGNAKTVMFINACPTARHAFESASSLKFAQRVSKVELGQAKKNVGNTVKKVDKSATSK